MLLLEAGKAPRVFDAASASLAAALHAADAAPLIRSERDVLEWEQRLQQQRENEQGGDDGRRTAPSAHFLFRWQHDDRLVRFPLRDSAAHELFFGAHARLHTARDLDASCRFAVAVDVATKAHVVGLSRLSRGLERPVRHHSQWQRVAIWRAIDSALPPLRRGAPIAALGLSFLQSASDEDWTSEMSTALAATGVRSVLVAVLDRDGAAGGRTEIAGPIPDGISRMMLSLGTEEILSSVVRFDAVWMTVGTADRFETRARAERFIVRAARNLLKPGGVLSLTVNVLVSSLAFEESDTPNIGMVVFRARDIEALAKRLQNEAGANLGARDFYAGDARGGGSEDCWCDAGQHDFSSWKMYRRGRAAVQPKDGDDASVLAFWDRPMHASSALPRENVDLCIAPMVLVLRKLEAQ